MTYGILLVSGVHHNNSVFLYTMRRDPSICLVTICHHTWLLEDHWLYSLSCTLHPVTFLTGSLCLLIPFTCSASPRCLLCGLPERRQWGLGRTGEGDQEAAADSWFPVSVSFSVLYHMFICFVFFRVRILKEWAWLGIHDKARASTFGVNFPLHSAIFSSSFWVIYSHLHQLSVIIFNSLFDILLIFCLSGLTFVLLQHLLFISFRHVER